MYDQQHLQAIQGNSTEQNSTGEKKHFHSVHANGDGIFNTCSGKLVDINHPEPEMIELSDIINALSKINRFGGHTNHFYSVAQHSILVASMVPEDCKKEALLHDAAEAYLGDIISPLKYILGSAYRDIEQKFDVVIATRFGLHWTIGKKALIKGADLQALEIEHEALQQDEWARLVQAMGNAGMWRPISYTKPEDAANDFIEVLRKYFTI